MFAATGVGLARGMRMVDALRLGMAAGALNATRRGLGTGTRDEIDVLRLTSRGWHCGGHPEPRAVSGPSARYDQDRAARVVHERLAGAAE